MRLFYEEELKRKSYYEMLQIAIDERLVEAQVDTLSRKELIEVILKYRGARADFCIKNYKEKGLENIQKLFDDKLNNRIHHENTIKVPHKIVLYKELDLTKEDSYKIELPDNISKANAFLINANNYLCGIFQLEKDLDSKNKFYLISKKEFFRIESLKNNKFSLLFFKERDIQFIYRFYNAKEATQPTYPYRLL